MKKLRLEIKATFPKENFFSLRFLISSSMIVIILQLQSGHKIYWNLLCKSKERFLKHIRSTEGFWKKPSSGLKIRFWPIFLVLPVMLLKTQIFLKELFRLSFLVLCSIKNLSEQFITAHVVSWIFCNIKLQFVRTYEAVGDIL